MGERQIRYRAGMKDRTKDRGEALSIRHAVAKAEYWKPNGCGLRGWHVN